MIEEYAPSTEGSSVAGTSGSLVYVEPRPKRVEESFIKLITQQAEDEQVGGGEVERKRSSSKKPVARKSPSRTRQPENPGQLRVLIVEVGFLDLESVGCLVAETDYYALLF